MASNEGNPFEVSQTEISPSEVSSKISSSDVSPSKVSSSKVSPEWPAFPTRLMALPAVSDGIGFVTHLYSRSKVSSTSVFVSLSPT